MLDPISITFQYFTHIEPITFISDDDELISYSYEDVGGRPDLYPPNYPAVVTFDRSATELDIRSRSFTTIFSLEYEGSLDLTIQASKSVDIALTGDLASTINIKGFSESSSLRTGDGDDIYNLTTFAHRDSHSDLLDIFTGAGNDTVIVEAYYTITPYSDITTEIDLSLGDDILIMNNNSVDAIYGGTGNDTINTGLADDFIDGGDGNDTIDGGLGVDTAHFASSFDDYLIEIIDPLTVRITDLYGSDGIDVLTNVEFFEFRGDGTKSIIDLTGGYTGAIAHSLYNINDYTITMHQDGSVSAYTDKTGQTQIFENAERFIFADADLTYEQISLYNSGNLIEVIVDGEVISNDPAYRFVSGQAVFDRTLSNYEIYYIETAEDIVDYDVIVNLTNVSNVVYIPHLGNNFFDYETYTEVKTNNFILNSGNADDYFEFSFGLVTLNAGAGNDWIDTGWFNDIIDPGAGDDYIDGGNDIDTVTYISAAEAVKIDLFEGMTDEGRDGTLNDTLINIENAIGSNYDDSIFGNSFDNVLNGLNGNDFLSGFYGNDTLYGGEGEDQLYGDIGDDVLYGDQGNDFLDGGSWNQSSYGSGHDTIYGGDGDDDIFGRDGHDNLHGDAGDDIIRGHEGNDTINGGSGKDTIYGGDGDDTLIGGLDHDDLFGDIGADTFAFEFATSFDIWDEIHDFNAGEGDKLDLSDILSNIGFNAGSDDITDFVKISDNGTHSYLRIDLDGNGAGFTQIARLNNVTSLTDEQQLLDNGTIIV